jgi:nucleoside-diphosphate-sugar epimerase
VLNKVFITGSNGFVGQNLIKYFSKNFLFTKYERSTIINLKEDIIIHLAGKAHDVKNVSRPSDYYESNTELTKKIFDKFLKSKASVFIHLSSVKAVADEIDYELTEEYVPNPVTHYGKSKLLAEQYILSKQYPEGKRVYILRPCMIHGPGNKGNLNLLYNFVSKRLPWPLGSYENARSYLSIENLCFIIKELIENKNIPSGVYNVADDVPLSTNVIIKLIGETQGKESRILKFCKPIITTIARFGDFLKLPINSERLQKLTESYVVSNAKIKAAIEKPLPISSKLGLLKTFQSFSSNV